MSGEAWPLEHWAERQRRFNVVTVELVCRCGHRVSSTRPASPSGEAGGDCYRQMQEHYAESPGCAPETAT